MEDFILWVFNSFTSLLNALTSSSLTLINTIIDDNGNWDISSLDEVNVNLVLFSETPILSLNSADMLLLFFSIFYTVIFIVIVWKIIKKVFIKITGWNKW